MRAVFHRVVQGQGGLDGGVLRNPEGREKFAGRVAYARWRAAGEFAFGEVPRAARLCGVVGELGRTANGGGEAGRGEHGLGRGGSHAEQCARLF